MIQVVKAKRKSIIDCASGLALSLIAASAMAGLPGRGVAVGAQEQAALDAQAQANLQAQKQKALSAKSKALATKPAARALSCPAGYEKRLHYPLAAAMSCLPIQCPTGQALIGGACSISASSAVQRAALVKPMAAAASQPTSCQPGFELRAPHMLATTSECLPIRCRDSEILEGGQCFLNGHSPTQLAALNQRMGAAPDPQLYCPADSAMVLHSAGYTWLCKPNNAYAFSGESQWPAAKNRVFEQLQQANAGLGAGRGCSAQVDWRDAKEPSRGFCRLELGVGYPLDASGNIKNGFSTPLTRYNEASSGSVNATCVDGFWRFANAVCNSTSNTYGHNDGTGKVVMDVGFSEAQTKLNAEIEAQRKANEAAVYAAEAAKNLAAQKASRAPLIAENLAIARDTTKEINARIGAYNQAHVWLEDGKQVGGMGPQCESAILAAQKSEGAIMQAQKDIMNDPHASAGAKGAAADRLLSLYMSATGAGGYLRGAIKQLCDDELNAALSN